MIAAFKNLWVEKYRPQVLPDLLLSKENEQIITNFVSKNEIPHLILLGSPGIGKTSLAKILVKSVLQCQYLYLNASDENGIDTIRTKVSSFAKTKSVDGKIKVIILDEADALSPEAQRALRNTVEEFSQITRFVLTGNFKHRIIPALISRCQSIELTPPIDKVVKLCYSILKKENITLNDETRNTFFAFVKKTYPDIRRCISELQKYSVNGTLILKQDTFDELFETTYKLLNSKDVLTIRRSLIEQESKFNGDYVNFLRNLFNYTDKTELDAEVKKKRLVVIAEYIYKSAFVIDQEINCYVCCIQLAAISSS